MKRLHEYTQEELVALDEDGINALINVECANEGAPLLSVAAPTAPVKPDVAPDVQCYCVDVRELLYTSAEEANRVAEFLNRTARLDTKSVGKSSWSPPYQLVPHDTDVNIKTEAHWTGRHYKAHQNDLEKYDTDKTAFDAEHREFRKNRESRDAVIQDVSNRIEDAREELNRGILINTQFDEYCALADGDRQMALAFLLKSGRYDEDIVRTTLNMEREKEHDEKSSKEEG